MTQSPINFPKGFIKCVLHSAIEWQDQNLLFVHNLSWSKNKAILSSEKYILCDYVCITQYSISRTQHVEDFQQTLVEWISGWLHVLMGEWIKGWMIDFLENRLSPQHSWEYPLGNKEIKLVNPKGNQPWIFCGRTDAEAEGPILWPPDMKSWLTGKDPDAGNDWGQEEKGATGRDSWMASLTQRTWV